MKTYLVKWKIHIEADTPEDAAKQALAIQRDPDSIATVFTVIPRDDIRYIDTLDEWSGLDHE